MDGTPLLETNKGGRFAVLVGDVWGQPGLYCFLSTKTYILQVARVGTK